METTGFEDYEVLSIVPRTFFGFKLPWKKSLELKGVLEADDKSGRVVSQVTTPEGHPIYTNGTDDIYLENAVKMLMLIPGVVAAFLGAGFRPKTETQHYTELKIINRNPSAALAALELSNADG